MNTFPTHHLKFGVRAATCAFAATLGAALFAQADTHADTTTTTTTTEHRHGDSLKHADRSFIEKAAKSGQEEVDVAQAVVEHSTNADVKKFAQMIVDDHTQANQQLLSLANARNVKIKADKDKAENKWAKKDPKDIDRDFVKKMVDDHKKDINLFSKESKDGGDPELVEFARNTLPKLQHHLEEANNLKNTIR